MSFDGTNPNRVDRMTYWMYYIGFTVVVTGLYAFAIYELLVMDTFPIVCGLLAPTLLSVFFRVIAMRRCHDIGWPSFLPWLTITLVVVCGVFNGIHAGMNPASALGTIGVTMVISMLFGLADFVFLIVLGCIPGTEGGGNDFEDRHEQNRAWVEAQYGQPASTTVRPAQRLPRAYGEADEPASQPVAARPTTGFGRRGL